MYVHCEEYQNDVQPCNKKLRIYVVTQVRTLCTVPQPC